MHQNIVMKKGSINFKIEPVAEEDMDEIALLCKEVFKEHETMASDPFWVHYYTQLSVSYKAVLDSKIIGCYLMNECPVFSPDDFILYEDIKSYSQKNGIQGVILALKSEYRGRGFGRQLRDMPLVSGKYDYCWGFHVKSLNNLGQWIRYGRRLIGEIESAYMTLMDLPKSAA